jgi:hypothetical protein
VRLAVSSLLGALALAPVAAGERDAELADAVRRNDVPALRATLAAIAREWSIDAGTMAFAATIESLPRNREFRTRFDAARADGPRQRLAAADYLFVFVPGWLYRVNPDSGADLAQPRAVLDGMGLATQLVPLDENGTVEANGAALAAALAHLSTDGRRLVLVSTSKGGPETHLALDALGRSGGAGHVAAWVNIGGLLNGTPLADHWGAWPRSWLAAFAFVFMGHGTAAIPTMRTAPRRARFPELRIPKGMLVVTYVGAPRAAEVTPGAQGDYAIIAPHGPNDGMTLLADTLVPHGVTLVERGLDHYFAAPDLDRRIAALAQAVLETLAER